MTTTGAATGPARRGRRVVVGAAGTGILLALAHAANDALTTVVPIFLPGLQVRFGFSETELAALVALLWATTSMTQPFLGTLADRLGARTMAAGGLALGAVLLALLGVAPSVPMVVALIAVGGIGAAALHPVGGALAHRTGRDRARLAVSLFSAGGQLGAAVGPLVAVAVLATFGLGGTPWLMAPGLALAAVLLVALPRDPPRTTVTPRECARCLLRGPVALLVVAGVLADLAFVAFVSAMPLWLVREAGLPDDSAIIGWTLAAFSLGAATGSLLAGLLAGRISRSAIITVTMVAAIAPLVAVLYLAVGGVAYYAAAAAAGALQYANFPLMILSAQDLAPGHVAAASGMLMGLATGVAGLLYVGVGRLQELLGMTEALTLAYLALAPAAAVALTVHRRHATAVGG